MKSFKTKTMIRAPQETIWKILTDAPRFTDWDTTVVQVEGRIALGERVTVRPKATPGRAFKLKVSGFEPGTRMVWTGGMPLGLFKGERTFTLTPKKDGHVEFAMEEVFSGFLSPLIVRSIPDLQPTFEEFAAALKQKAESRG